MAKRAKTPAAPNSVQSEADLVRAVATKGQYDRDIEALVAEAEKAATQLKEALKLGVSPIVVKAKQLVKDIQGYAEAHRLELTNSFTRKTVDLETGEIGWRNDPPSVSVVGDERAAIAVLMSCGLTEFVRTVQVVDKEAILATRRAWNTATQGTPTWQKHNRTLEALDACECVNINVGVEKFFVTPLTIPTPEMDGAAAVTEEVAA
jgi:phage host-nuclease inhibitor protein Gam